MRVSEHCSVDAASTTAQKTQPRRRKPAGLCFLCGEFRRRQPDTRTARTRGVNRGFESHSDEPVNDLGGADFPRESLGLKFSKVRWKYT